MSLSNLHAAWALVNEGDLLFGTLAYPNYHTSLRKWSEFYEFGFVQTVEAFVALSPNNDYHGNLRSLSSVMQNLRDGGECPVSTYQACATRAAGYLTGEVSFSDKVRGPKITAFRDNILYLDASRRVTVDGHMVSLWAGHPMTMKDAAAYLSDRNYSQIEADFLTLSKRQRVPPCVVQAALWGSRKRRLGVKYDGQLGLFTGKTKWDSPATPEEYPPFRSNKDECGQTPD